MTGAIVEEGPRCRKSLRIMRDPESFRRGEEMTRCFSANRLVPIFSSLEVAPFRFYFAAVCNIRQRLLLVFRGDVVYMH